MTHSLVTVIVVAGGAAVWRRRRAVLAGVVTGLLIHFARDIAEGPPGVRMLWPLQDTAWTASYWWFLGMILTFTTVRLILVSARHPPTRARPFYSPTSEQPLYGTSESEGSDIEGAVSPRARDIGRA